MDTPTFENLDLACAKAGRAIVERPSNELYKIVTDALAVLEEQGIYAFFLYLDKGQNGKEKKELAKEVMQKLQEFLKTTPQQTPLLSGNTDIFTSLQETAKDLDKLLLARDILRQALIYARYHARLREKTEVGP